MHTDDVGLPEQFRQRGGPGIVRRSGRWRRRKEGIVVQQLRVEGMRSLGYRLTDSPESHEPKRLPGQLEGTRPQAPLQPRALS